MPSSFRHAQLELRTLSTDVWPATPAGQSALLKRLGLSASPQECVWVVAYDSQHNLRTLVEIARGSHLGAQVHVPTLLSAVLASGAERFMLIHNHPNGSAQPSNGDVALTLAVASAAKTCWMYLEDHLIVTPNERSWYSFVQSGVYTPMPYGDEKNAAASQR